MKKHIHSTSKGHIIRGAFYLLLVLAACVTPFTFAQWQTHAGFSKNNATMLSSPAATPAPCIAYTWSAGPDIPSTGVRMVGVYFYPNGKFYAVGGRSMDGVGNDFAHPFEYDPGSNTWTIKSATYPDNQVSNMACGVLNDSGTYYTYCIGGSAGGQTTATDRVFRYNPVTDTIETIASPWPGDADGITLPGGFAVYNNKLYILGGFRINTAMTNQIWEFTPTTNVWVLKNAVLPVARGFIPAAAYTFFPDGIYTAGGSDWNGTTLVDTNDSFRYYPIGDYITAISSIPRATGETRAFMFGLPDTLPYIFVMGGGRTPPNPSNQINVYSPGGNSWFTGGGFITARRNFATGTDGGCAGHLDPIRHIWVAGGYGSDGTPLSSMEIYCFPCATVTPTATPTPTRTPTPTATATPSPTSTPVQCVLFESFDFVTPPALPQGWTATNGINPDGILWQTSNSGLPSPPADSTPNAAWVNDPAAISDKYLDSPPIIIGQLENAALMFRNNYSLEAGRDGGVLEVSIDGGPFQDILAAGGFFGQGGYNGTISSCCGNPLAGRNAWTGSSGGFIETTLDLPFQGHTIVLRWRMGSDSSGSGEGWRVDTIMGACEKPTPTSTPTAPPPTPTATFTPTSTPTATPTGTPTPTATTTPTPTLTPSPTARPTPALRPRPTPPPRP